MFRFQELRRVVAIVSLVLFGLSASPALASICCKCHVASDSTVNLCLTSDTTATCNDIVAKSQNATNLQGVTCDASPLDPKTTCQPFGGTSPGVCTGSPTDATSYTSSTASYNLFVPPTLNVPIPGVVFTTSTPSAEKTISLPYIAQYLSGVYRYLIGLSIITAAVMIVYGGFKYILGASITSITSGRQTIVDAVIGLFLVFGAYTILAVVNPATLTYNAVTIPVIQPAIYTVPEGTFQTLQQRAVSQGFKPDPDVSKAIKSATGGTQPTSRMFPSNPFDPRTTLPVDQLDSVLSAIATKSNIDVCVLKAIVATESGRRMNAIGHDEEAGYVGVQARLDFLRSGTTYSKQTFAPPGIPASVNASNKTEAQAVVNASSGIHNDDTLSATPPDYGLDWRFSHGFGVSQCTIFPKGKGANQCNGPDGGLGISTGGTCYTVPILMTWEGNLSCMASLIKSIAGGTSDPCKIFVAYSGDKTDPTCTGQLLSRKMAAYNSCKGT